jgi:hypothetical protein
MARTSPILLAALTLACAWGTLACGGDSAAGPPRTCSATACGDAGTCFEEGGYAWCSCPAGTHPDGLACAANHPTIPCDGVTCNDRGWCRVGADGLPACDCFDGFHPAAGGDLLCLPDAPPDAGPDVEDGGSEGDADGEAGFETDTDAESETETDADADSGCRGELDGPCHLSRQCGCLDGERCIATTAGPSGWIEACTSAGSTPAGTSCTMMMDDCVAGSQCLAPFGQFACERFCTGAADCAGTECVGGVFPGTLYGFCAPTMRACVAVTGEGCDAGLACRVIPATTLRTYCGTAGPGGENADCLAAGCQLGFACHITDFSTILCRRYCRLASAGDCTSGSCTDVYGNGSVGLCLPPTP